MNGQLKLSTIFSNDMILQQNQSVSVWGEATPGKSVKVTPSWNNKEYFTKVENDGKWKVQIQTPAASYNQYNIRFEQGKFITLENILIGEVWLASGQSNMNMPMYGYGSQPVEGALQDIAMSRNKAIRCFNVKRKSTTQKTDNVEGKWVEASPSTTGNFSATAYYFARQIQQALDVPVGIIHSSWGGSTIETWMSKEAIKEFPEKRILEKDEEIEFENRSACLLFNGMIQPLVGFGMRGVIWYQGEGNLKNYNEYAALFKIMHNDWQQKWGIGTFPIYFAQIAPYLYRERGISPYMKEQQLIISQQQPNTGMAVLLDAGNGGIHPSNKRVVGERLSYLALAKTYGFSNLPHLSPTLKQMSVKADTVNLVFSDALRGLTSNGKPLTLFEIAGDDQKFYKAKALIRKDAVLVWAAEVKKPTAVRYAFADDVRAELFSTEGLPVSSFRTNHW